MTLISAMLTAAVFPAKRAANGPVFISDRLWSPH